MKTKRAVNLRTIPEWWDIMARRFERPGLVALEQAYFQSMRHKVCVECLGTTNLVLQTGRYLIQATDFYMCQDCVDYYAEKYAKED